MPLLFPCPATYDGFNRIFIQCTGLPGRIEMDDLKMIPLKMIRLQIADHIAVVTMDLARQITVKHALNTIEEMTLHDGYRFEQNRTVALQGTDDPKEAMRALIEKRKPVFKGR